MLKKALLANCIFSTGSGIIMLVFASVFVQHLMLPLFVVNSLAVGLLGFAGVLVYLANNIHVALKVALYVVIADILWVLVTLVLLVVFATGLSLFGMCIIIVVNIIVASLAAWQYYGFRLDHDFARYTG